MNAPLGPQRPTRYGGMGAVPPGTLTDVNGNPYKYRDFYTYEVDFAALGAGASATATFTVQADSDFIWEKATYFADIAAAAMLPPTLIVPLVTVLITDTGSGRQLMSGAVPIPSMFGSGSLPFIVPRPRQFRSQSTVTVQLTSYVAAGTTYNIRLSFIGEKGFWA